MADRPGSSPSGDPPGPVAAGGTPDGDRDAALDAIATVMRSVFGVPFVAFALAGPERPAARARGGTEAEGSPEARFCRHAVLEQRVLEVADAAADVRLAGHPAVAGRPSIRGFLGTPLATAEGYTFGALGVIDTRPRRFAARLRGCRPARARPVPAARHAGIAGAVRPRPFQGNQRHVRPCRGRRRAADRGADLRRDDARERHAGPGRRRGIRGPARRRRPGRGARLARATSTRDREGPGPRAARARLHRKLRRGGVRAALRLGRRVDGGGPR